MKENLLDNNQLKGAPSKQSIIKLVLLILASTIYYLLAEIIRPYLSKQQWSLAGDTIQAIAIIQTLAVVVIALLLTRTLNQIKPMLSLWKIILGTGFLIVVIELLFRGIQSLLWDQSLFSYTYLMGSFFIAIFGMLVSNISIRQLRKKNTKTAFLLLIIAWITAGVNQHYF